MEQGSSRSTAAGFHRLSRCKNRDNLRHLYATAPHLKDWTRDELLSENFTGKISFLFRSFFAPFAIPIFPKPFPTAGKSLVEFFAVPFPWKTKHGVAPLIINSIIKKKNNELINFHHEMFGDIRAIEKDGGPWFVGKDVAVALEYCKPENALAAHVD
jgi:hypothetical protein